MFQSDRPVEEIIEVKEAVSLDAEPWKGDGPLRRVLIRGGRVVNEDRVFEADVLVEDGCIRQVGRALTVPVDDVRIIEADGRYVMPGGIDTLTHLHRSVKGSQSVDDFTSGSRAALVGGTTCVLEMAVPRSGQTLVDAVLEWRRAADQRVCCDYSLHVAVTSWSQQVADQMRQLVTDHGVSSFLFYMSGAWRLDDTQLLAALAECKQLGALALVHAESGDVVEAMSRRLLAAGLTTPAGHALSRPDESEESALLRASVLAHQTGCPLYVPHVMSTAAAERLAARRRQAGCILYGDVTPAALAADGAQLMDADSWSQAAAHLTSPPLPRDPGTRQQLLRLLANGDLQCVGSDHMSHSHQQRAVGADDFTRIPSGVNGVEERMMVLWQTGVVSGLMDPRRFVAATSTTAAKIFNLYPQKGVIAPGSDADLVVWHPTAGRRISAKTQTHRAELNVLEGVQCSGSAEYVLVRGRVCVDAGRLRVAPGSGMHVDSAPFSDELYLRVEARDRSHAAAMQPDSIGRDVALMSGAAAADVVQHGHGDGQHRRRRQLQDSAGSAAPQHEAVTTRTSVKVHAPPGGKSSVWFW